ncbi:MAG TPA: TolC family protein [Polyangiaceae bacterium]|nr:TolC family protein [Polyangiaceae bacterium]
MTRNALVARTALALLLSATSSLAQTAPAPAPTPEARAPVRPTLAPPPAPVGAAGPDAPVSKVTQELQAKLESMMQGNGLTANQVAERAVKSSAQIQAKRREIESAEASVDQAKYSFLPALNLKASYTRLSKIPDLNFGPLGSLSFPVNNYVLSAGVTVPLSDYLLRTSRAVSGANRVKNAADIDARATQLSVARDAKVAYYQWIRAQGMAFVGAQAVEQAKGHLTDANNAFQAGLVSKADVLRAQSGLKSAELFLEQANSGVELATTRLRVMMKDQPGKHYEVGENILAPIPPLPNTSTPDAAYREASQQRLELKVLAENEQALRDQAALTSAGNLPRLDGAAGAEYSNPNSRYFPPANEWHSTWYAGVTLSWTPTDIFKTQASSRSLDAKAAEVAAQRQGMLDGLEYEVSQALNAERDAEFAVSVSQQALAASEEGYRVRRELFRSGRATLVEVTDSETELTRARLELVNAHVDLRIAQVQLAHALGRDAK